MLVIADASPLHYLILLESTDILNVLFDRIVMPQAVAAELQHPQTPAVVRVWMATPPAWLYIQDVGTAPDASLSHLDRGEQEVITLAQALHTDLLLIDDWEGRREAELRALTVTGILGVLERAVQRELLDLPSTLTRLLASNFYAPANLIRDMLARDADRKSRPTPDCRRGRGYLSARQQVKTLHNRLYPNTDWTKGLLVPHACLARRVSFSKPCKEFAARC
jgi:predicted nucleic acid-binding protein